mgnify:CR=1 FL=1
MHVYIKFLDKWRGRMLGFILLFICFTILFIISTFVKDKKLKKIISIISLVVLCIISGTRYNVGGTDYFMYKNIYQSLPTSNIFSQMISFCSSTGLEHGFYLYLSVIKLLGFNYYGFTLINSIVFYFLFYKVLKRYDYNINFVLILFLYKMFFYNTMISMRQPISIIIFWLSLPYLKDKKYIIYYLMCFVALFFHRSSVILFLLPLVTHFKISKNTYFILLIAFFASFIFVKLDVLNISGMLQNVLNFIFRNDNGGLSRLDNYLSSSYGMSIFYLLEYYSIALLLYKHYDKIISMDSDSYFFVKLFICLLPMYTIFSNFSVVTRFKDFFFLSYPFVLIYISRCLQKNKFLLYFITILVCFYGFMRYINNFDSGEFKNYRSFIFEEVSIMGDK